MASNGNHDRLPNWRAMHADTQQWAEDAQLQLFRQTPAWRKLEILADLNRGMLLLAESGLRARHPEATSAEIRRRLADMVLGPELAARVYGPLLPEDDKSDAT